MADDSPQPKRALTVKQRRFADFYLGQAKGNGTEAARLAGYSDPEVSAFDNKQNPAVRAYIDERLQAETLSSAEVLAELTDVGRAEWRDFVTVRTHPKTGETLDVRMDLAAKIKSLELLGKHHALFTDKIDHTGTVTFADLFSAANGAGSAGGPDGGGRS